MHVSLYYHLIGVAAPLPLTSMLLYVNKGSTYLHPAQKSASGLTMAR